jgi:ParB family chromosome partitioning protein
VSVKSRLIQPSEFATAIPDPAEGRLDVPLALIDPNPHNPRGTDLADVHALADNIRTFGLLQPVLVRRVGARFQLLAGHRRTAAFRILQQSAPDEACWQTIPAEVRVEDDDRAYLAMLSAQVHMRAWTSLQEAAALERLAAAGLTLTEIAALVHKTPAWASKRLRIYADPVLSSRVQTGQLAPGVAEELLPIHELAQRQALAQQAVAEAWSQPVARAEARRVREREQVPTIAQRLCALSEFLMRMDAQTISPEDVRQLEKLRERIDALLTGNEDGRGHDASSDR